MLIGKYTIAAAISCSVSYKYTISPEELKALLSGEKHLTEKWQSHISTLFNEVPHAYLKGVMKELNLSYEDLTRVFYSLPPIFQSKHFKEFNNYA